MLIIEDAAGSRRAAPGDFPLALGGRDADVRLPDVEGPETLAWLGLRDGDLFLQSGGAGARVTCNGMPVTASQWVRAGDVLRVGTARVTLESLPDGLHLKVDRIEKRDDAGDPVIIVATRPTAGDRDRVIRPVEFRPRDAVSRPRRRWRLRPALILGAGTLLVLVAAGWYVVSVPRVRLQVEPEPDRLELRGGFTLLQMAGRYLLAPGTYSLTAEKEGYRRLEVTLQVTGDEEQSFAFALERLPGFLEVDTGGVEGAEVLVDGAVIAGAPRAPIELAPGEYEVRVRASRYQEFITNITMKGAGASQTIRAELVPLWSDVRFDSAPPAAAVRVDGELIGNTPIVAQMMPGTHRLEFRLEGHQTVRDSIRVKADQPQTWPRVNLVLQEGRLVLRSEPDGATVAVNGAYRGETPMDLYLKPEREHELTLTKAGHEPESTMMKLGAGETREWTARLAARTGEVEIVATPAGAELYVNGERRGTAGGLFSLPAVPHQIEIRMEGYQPYRATVTPRPGFPESIRVALEPANPDVMATAPRTIRTPAGQELVLIDGGRFRMGASRREPGRRANETLREVELTRPFYLARKEVTNREFVAFQAEHLSGFVGSHSMDLDDQPVVRVTWEEAAAYCDWLSEQASLPPVYASAGGRHQAVKPISTGYRLPLEAEWAWAARYHQGARVGKYPWGESLPVAPRSGNYADLSAQGILSRVLKDYDDTFAVTAPVGSFPPNDLELYEMGGNVAEWVHDIYVIYGSGAGTVSVDPTGGEEGDLHVIRGSSWMQSSISELRLTYRDYSKTSRPDVGFRVARYVE